VKQRASEWKRTYPLTFWYILAMVGIAVGVHILNQLLATQSLFDVFWR
jgi:hypothetical protein